MRTRYLKLLLPVLALAAQPVAREARAQVNGNATISGSAFGVPLTVSTSSQFAGSVSSIKLGSREFINNWDHGRQLQGNFQFFNRFECYNPYEAGSFLDGNKHTSTSRLLSLSAAGNRLETNVRMAWYLDVRDSTNPLDYCGDPNQWLPAPPYTGPLSTYEMHKVVTIGYAGLPNVIEYLSDLYVPEHIQKGINNITAVLPFDFSSVLSYDVVAKEYRNIRLLSGEDDRIKVAATPDGSYAMAFYSPELLGPFGGLSGYTNWWRSVPPDPFYRNPNDPSQLDYEFACMHIGSINRYNVFDGPGQTHDRSYIVVGSLEQVKTTLGALHNNFRALDPEVFNWKDYIKINYLEPYFTDAVSAEQHWLAHGIAEGRRGSTTFSPVEYLALNPDVADFFGATNYQGAIDHYVSSGRYEGRSTVAKVTAGMQHMLVDAGRDVTGTGQNAVGQLTNGDGSPALAPKQVSGLGAITETVAGDYTSFAVAHDGTLWMWGSNRYGARGDGSSGDNITQPVQVPLGFKVSTPSRAGKHAVAVGTGVYAAIDTTGQVWTWGQNWNGRLGDGTKSAHLTPARVRRSAAPGDYFTGAVSISAGGGTVAVADADEIVWTWGAGANGALGNGAISDSAYPVQVIRDDGSPLTGVREVACGSSGFCIALAGYGGVYGWGNNNLSQLGIAPGGNLAVATLIPISFGYAIQRIAAGAAHAIALSADGNVYGWGYNGRGQLGRGNETVAQDRPVPMLAGPHDMRQIDDLAAGANFSVMIRNSDRAVFVAGDNQSGQLGVSSQSVQVLPVRYGQPAPVVTSDALNISARAKSDSGDGQTPGGSVVTVCTAN